jgi:hypothetical protein
MSKPGIIENAFVKLAIFFLMLTVCFYLLHDGQELHKFVRIKEIVVRHDLQ